MDELKKSPIQVINAQIKAGGGRIDLTSASVQSTAFKADGQGGIALAQVLTNSTINIPIAISVSQSIGKQLNLASGTASTNATYVPLPQFWRWRNDWQSEGRHQQGGIGRHGGEIHRQRDSQHGHQRRIADGQPVEIAEEGKITVGIKFRDGSLTDEPS